MPAPLRCSSWARQVRLDPVGTAGSYRGFLLVELPPPWPHDIGELAQVGDLIEGRGLRLQGLLGARSGGQVASGRRVIAYLNPLGDGFGGFAQRETETAGDLRAAVRSVLEDPAGGGRVDPATGRDVLVCTHGSRDVCCGSRGTELFSALVSMPRPEGVRLWRTSHTGGHRFAPTFIVLPEGTLWAYADADLVTTVLERRGHAAEVADRYRGCAGLPGGPVQALEREVLRRVGWDLLDRVRAGGATGVGRRTRLVVERPGGSDTWEAEVRPGRVMPVPDCGRPTAEARKSETEWVVSGLRLA